MPKKKTTADRKKDGFNGQKAIVLPNKVVKSCESIPLVNQLFITDIGFYPRAKYHYRERQSGISQHILIYCTDGRGWLRMGKKKVEIEPGNYLIIPANIPHTYGSYEEDPWSIFWLHFKGTVSSNVAHLLSKQQTQFARAVSFSDERIRLFDNIYKTLEYGYSADSLSFINMSLYHFLASFCYPDFFYASDRVKEKDAIDISIDFMQQHIHEVLLLKDLAAVVHISPSHYSTLFKKKTGYTPLEYFNHIKVQKACQYLQFTNLHVKEIGYLLGINDPYYFSRFFSNLMGQSPMEYRNRKQ
jgi:AraC-like DNA-binding protein/mannose-6-phosphate isomerase-like protein (cupin superfamily)